MCIEKYEEDECENFKGGFYYRCCWELVGLFCGGGVDWLFDGFWGSVFVNYGDLLEFCLKLMVKVKDLILM